MADFAPAVAAAQGGEGQDPATVGLMEEGRDTSRQRPVQPRSLRRGVLAAALGALGLLATTWVAARPAVQSHGISGEPGESVSLAAGALAAMAEGLAAVAKVAQDAQGGEKDLQKTWASMGKPAEDIMRAIAEQGPPPNITDLLSLKGEDLLPNNNLQDDNVCPDDEESLLSLCYKKCSKLTNGTFPIRTSAFSCCMEAPCSFFNSKFSNPLKPCQGLDVAGRFGGLGRGIVCPHSPGDCLRNEEFNLGVCYKKCALLTNNTHPYRFAAGSCCRVDNQLACMIAGNLLTSPDFDIGGGAGDEIFEPSAGLPHTPMPQLAESQ